MSRCKSDYAIPLQKLFVTEISYIYHCPRVIKMMFCISEVYVSSDGKDNPSCLISSIVNPCRTLSYAIQHGIQTLYVVGTLSNDIEDIKLNSSINSTHRTYDVIITGLQAVLSNYTIFIGSSANKFGKISVENITILDSNVTLEHCALLFQNCKLSNTFLHDVESEERFHHIQIALKKSSFVCDEQYKDGIVLNNRPILKLEIIESEILFCQLRVKAGDLYLVIMESNITATSVSFDVKSLHRIPAIVRLENTSFEDFLLQRGTPAMQFNVINLHCYMTIRKCHFTSYPVSI